MLSREEIIAKLRTLLLEADESKADIIEKADESSVLATDLGLSSIGMLYMVISIEESFGIRFHNLCMDDLKTLKDVVDLIQKLQKEA